MKKNKEKIGSNQLIKLYQQLQNKPWGKTTIVEGFYHVSLIANAETRKTATAYTRWKQFHDDTFDTENIFAIPIGALFNKSSHGPSTSIENLEGKVICVKCLKSDGTAVYGVEWCFANDLYLPPSDLLLDWMAEEEFGSLSFIDQDSDLEDEDDITCPN